MRFVPLCTLVVIFSAGALSPAKAIINGTSDGDGHPSVGALIADRPYRDGTYAYCTGTLISPTVLVTAAHCGRRGQKTARVTFSPRYRKGDPVYTGRYDTDPRYVSSGDLYDIAVVVFDTPVPGIAPARLPAAGLLDRMAAAGTLKNARFTPVGYGSSVERDGARKPRFVYTDTRERTTISFDDLTRSWLKLTVDPGDGGTCYGDSGGPNFLADTDVLVATSISGDDDSCKSTNWDYRLDTQRARSFLRRFVALP